MKFFNIVALAAAAFSTFAAASPIAAPAEEASLVRRTSDSDINNRISGLTSDIKTFHDGWVTKCGSGCTNSDWNTIQTELCVIIDVAIKDLQVLIGSGFTIVDVQLCINGIVVLLIEINVCLLDLLKLCGFSILTLLIQVVLGLCNGITVCIIAFIRCLAPCFVDDIFVLLKVAFLLVITGTDLVGLLLGWVLVL